MGKIVAQRPPIITIAPSKYVQGPGVLADAVTYLKKLGTSATVICTRSCWERVGGPLARSAEQDGLALSTFFFNGESSRGQIEAGVAAAREHGAEVIVGLGGGKAIDTAKSVAAHLKLNCAILPTIASTDAPCSALSVVYTDGGDVETYEFHPRNPDLVLVDSAIVARAGARFLVSGMADALATRWEGMAAIASGTTTCAGGRPSNAATALGQLCWENCRTYGLAAKRAVEAGAVTPAVEIIIETNTYHSGVGFESGGFSGAHAIHNGLTELPATHGLMHGEKVAFGLLCHLVLEGRSDAELDEYLDFATAVGLPVTLRDLNLPHLSDAELLQVARRATIESETIHWMPFPVTADMVAGAILGADAYASAYIREQQARGRVIETFGGVAVH